MIGQSRYIGALLMILLVPFCALDCFSAGDAASAESANELTTKLARANNQFGLALYQKIRETETGNIFIAPYSVSSALAMTWAGATGETATEMSDVLGLTPLADQAESAFSAAATSLGGVDSVEMNIANSLWPSTQFALEPDYRTRMKSYFDVEIESLDYVTQTDASRQRINQWVERETREKIKDLITPGAIDPMTMMVLVNAIYFKGNWASQFDPALTSDGLFKNVDCKAQVVKMMHQKREFLYTEIEDVKILEMPYIGDRLAMTILLPPDMKSLASLEKSLTVEKLDSWLKQMRSVKVAVSIPKFTETWGTTDVTSALKSLGIKRAFTGQAEFTRMTAGGGINIDMVLHKTFIEVNEEGSEAAGATAVVMRKTAVIRPLTFTADHPFLYMIRDRQSGMILFMGRLMEI